MLFLVTINVFNANLLGTRKEKNCENPCSVCQKTIYKLKFHKQADCGASRCKSTCLKVWELWNRPQSPFAGFQGDSIGKCDSCFRAGLCSITDCNAQKSLEKTVIDQVVNKSKLSGFVDTSVMKKMLKKVLNNKPVDFRRYSKKIKKQIKKSTQPKTFKKNFKSIAKTLKVLAQASTPKDLKLALNQVNKALGKAKTSQTVKDSIRKLTEKFNSLATSSNKTSKRSARKVVKQAKSVKRDLKSELKNLQNYAKRLKKAQKNVQSSLDSLKNKKSIKGKTQKKISKLEDILNQLKQVLNVLINTEKDINNTLAVIKQAEAQFKK